MADDKDEKKTERKRMVVEEVQSSDKPEESHEHEEKEDIEKEEVMGGEHAMAGEEIKEKVEELQDITEHIGEDVEKSEDVQEDLAKAADKFVQKPSVQDFKPKVSFEQSSRGPSPLLIIIPGVLILGAILGGVYFYQKSLSGSPSATPTSYDNMATTAPGASASPEATLDLTKYPINVQNGSGIAGVAGSVKDLLTKAGFEVSAAGNAKTYDYTDTVIQAKSDVPQAFLDKLQTELEGVYSVNKPETLPDSSKDEVVVIVGSSKSQ